MYTVKRGSSSPWSSRKRHFQTSGMGFDNRQNVALSKEKLSHGQPQKQRTTLTKLLNPALSGIDDDRERPPPPPPPPFPFFSHRRRRRRRRRRRPLHAQKEKEATIHLGRRLGRFFGVGEVRERGKRERERPPILSRVWTWLSGGEDVEEEKRGFFCRRFVTKSFIHQEEKGVGKVFLLSGFFTSSGRGDSYAGKKLQRTSGGERQFVLPWL